jgi:two-component system, response regulator PdtaR
VKVLRVLIVEDEILLAMDLEFILEDCGCEVAGIATCAKQAFEIAASTQPTLAFVDVNLSDGPTGIEVARILSRELSVPVVFMTANAARLPSDFAGALGVIGKPYTVSGLSAAVSYLGQGILRPPPTAALPGCLSLSSEYTKNWNV